jgi:ribosomal protein S6
MNKYELLLVLPGTFDENETTQHINEVMEVIKAHGEEAELHNMGKMRLSYPIKQIRYGYYYTVVFQAEPANVVALHEKLRLRTDLLRAMISHYKVGYTAAKKIIYSTNEAGVTTMVEKSGEEKAEEKTMPAGGTVDLKDIDKKLNEILDNEIMPNI